MEFLEDFNGIKFMGNGNVYNGYLNQEQTWKEYRQWALKNIYDEGDTITNPFSGESYDLDAAETSMYDLIMGINYVGDHRGWDDELITTHQKALSWFRTVNPKAYMVLLD